MQDLSSPSMIAMGSAYVAIRITCKAQACRRLMAHHALWHFCWSHLWLLLLCQIGSWRMSLLKINKNHIQYFLLPLKVIISASWRVSSICHRSMDDLSSYCYPCWCLFCLFEFLALRLMNRSSLAGRIKSINNGRFIYSHLSLDE